MTSVQTVVFAPSWEGWRRAARDALRARVAPHAVVWRAADDAQLSLLGDPEDATDATPDDRPRTRADAARAPHVPREFVALGARVACHRDPERWTLLYRVLWRLVHGERHLLQVDVDPDVHRVLRFDAAVRREIHRVHAFVRFRRAGSADGAGADRYVAWFEPAHPVLELAAPFFARRFGSAMHWSILTPDCVVHWDGETLDVGPGVPAADARAHGAVDGDALEALWQVYYASVFNPARARPRALRGELPKRYWANLPEASIIPALEQAAAARTAAMLAAPPTPAPPMPRGRRPGTTE